MYRLVDTASRHCPLCGALNGVPATDAVEPLPVEPPPAPEPAPAALAIRYVGRRSWYADQMYGTGLIWHGYGDIQPIADRGKARRMAQNHPDVYALVEVEPD